MDKARAFAALALAAVACDGVLARDEAHALRGALEHRTPYREQSEQAMGTLFDELLTELRGSSCEALAEKAVAVLDPQQQETALAVAAELVHSDREVSDAESRFLERLSALLTIPRQRAATIVEVIAVLHRDSLA
jgi:hypothetical protein